MIGRLATKLYHTGRKAYVNTLKLLVAKKIIGGNAPKPTSPFPKGFRPKKAKPVTAKVVHPRHNQTVPPRHTPQARAQFRNANNRRV
jgi:hypothetical protein